MVIEGRRWVLAERPEGLPAGAIKRLDPAVFRHDIPPEAAIGVLGNAGLTAYFGLLRIGEARRGDVVLVSSASGSVGSAVGQIARPAITTAPRRMGCGR